MYNERLLKGYSSNASLRLQNIFMYVDSCLCNLLVIAFIGKLGEAFSREALQKIVLVPSVMLIILNNAARGLITGAFLKYLNSILKVFASSIEPALLALLCLVIFGHPITVYTAVSVVLVTVALVLCSTNPLLNLSSPASL